MSHEDRVLPFRPQAPEREEDFPATLKPWDYRHKCRHGRVVDDEQGREVTCALCKAVLDPISVLADWAKRWDRERWSIREQKRLDRLIAAWHAVGGRIAVRPSGVVVTLDQRRWASGCQGGVLEQLRSALESAVPASLPPPGKPRDRPCA